MTKQRAARAPKIGARLVADFPIGTWLEWDGGIIGRVTMEISGARYFRRLYMGKLGEPEMADPELPCREIERPIP